MGAAVNPSGVEGLEIVVWTDTEKRKLADAEIAELAERSKELELEIATALGLN